MTAGQPESWSIELGRDRDAPKVARRGLVERFPDLPVSVRENALVVVTELVTNAVRWGSPPIHVHARRDAEMLALAVGDDGDGRPHRRVPASDGGIGLNLVYLLADRVEIDAARSEVRCEFDIRARHIGPPGHPLGEVEVIQEEATTRIVLRGEIDLTARPELDAVLADLDRTRPQRVMVDLREVTFFDTTGLHMAHSFDRWGRDHGVPVVFTRGSSKVMLALRAAGLALRLRFDDE